MNRSLINHALISAEQSKHRYKLGAVVFKQGKILSKGYNETKRGVGKITGYWEGSLHAEVSAILGVNTSVYGASVLVVRRNLRNSRPCVSCLAFLKRAGIKRVFYFQDNALINERL